MENRLRVAWISTFPPVISGLSHYSQVIADYIDSTFEHIKIEKVSSLPRDDMKSVFDIRAEDYNRLVYNIGNHPYNENAYAMCIRHPGIVILHDLNLHDLIFYMTYSKGDFRGYVSYLLTERGMTPDMVRKMVSSRDRHLFFNRFPMLSEILDSGSVIVVHSEAAKRFIKEAGGSSGTVVINHFVEKQERVSYSRIPVVIGVFGFMDSSKYINEVIKAFSESGLQGKVRLLFVGTEVDTNLRSLASKYGVADFCEFVDTPSDNEFDRYIRSVQAGINLRRGNALETSGNMLKLMAAGKCVAAIRKGSAEDYEIGSFYEIDECGIDGSLIKFFNDAIAEPLKMEAIGAKAYEYASTKHDIALISQQIVSQLTLMPLPVQKRSRKISVLSAYRYLTPRLIISDIRRKFL